MSHQNGMDEGPLRQRHLARTTSNQATMITITQPPRAVPLHRFVRLIQCGRRSCGYVLTEDEREWRQDPEWEARKTAICPKCGEDGFYTLNEKGQQITMRDSEKYRNGLNPATIEPSTRMGLKMRRIILAAKRRALCPANDKHSNSHPEKIS